MWQKIWADPIWGRIIYILLFFGVINTNQSKSHQYQPDSKEVQLLELSRKTTKRYATWTPGDAIVDVDWHGFAYGGYCLERGGNKCAYPWRWKIKIKQISKNVVQLEKDVYACSTKVSRDYNKPAICKKHG